MEGLLEVVVAEELFNRREINRDELNLFKDTTIMRFVTIEHATDFGRRFGLEYLIPRYGVDGVMSFPMAKTEPARLIRSIDEGAKMIGEFVGAIPREEPPKEIWLVVPNGRYHEVQQYLDSVQG